MRRGGGYEGKPPAGASLQMGKMMADTNQQNMLNKGVDKKARPGETLTSKGRNYIPRIDLMP